MVSGIDFKHPKICQVIEFSLYLNTIIASFFKLFIPYYEKPSKAIFIINSICELIIIISVSFFFFFQYKMSRNFIDTYLTIVAVFISLTLVIEIIALFVTRNSNFTGPSIIILVFGDLSSISFVSFGLAKED